ncbi:MAG: 1-acyl-sn-glycerol-3-phosphate acyltransferase [Planctomycetes bacterium]|nr:1-acyl-sn-glycerol-3-phosphate acyltransferase [Planctomycetota bacterium]
MGNESRVRAKGESEPRSRWQRAGYSAFRVAARLAGVLGWGLRTRGRRNYPRGGGGLICANHQSFLDPVLVGLTCDRRLNYLARSSLFHSKPLRVLIEFLDAIPIEREGIGLAGLKETLRRLKRGELVLIFPEGTRTHDGRIGELKPGFCAVARRGDVPLIPVGIAGANLVWPRGRAWPGLGTISIVTGMPIPPELFRAWDDAQLVTELDRRIRDCHRDALQLAAGSNGGAAPNAADMHVNDERLRPVEA